MAVLRVIAMALLMVGVCMSHPHHDHQQNAHKSVRSHNPRPPYTDYARYARWLVHESSYNYIATQSQRLGVPFPNLISYADGTAKNCTGEIYVYIGTLMDIYTDFMANATVGIGVFEASLANGNCATNATNDPMLPTCGKVHLSGTMVRVTEPAQVALATKFLFDRHPNMATWPTSHDWEVFKLRTTHIEVLDYFGGCNPVNVTEYFGASCL